MISDVPGLKAARHRGIAVDPETVSREPTSADEREVQSLIRRNLPAGDGPTLALRICLYTNSPDGHFIIDRVPGKNRTLIACGFSGHGFKFSSAIGEALADLATQGKSNLPIDFLTLNRFRIS